LKYESFSNFSKVTKLSITEEREVNSAVFQVISKFSNLQELRLDGSLHPLTIKKNDAMLLENIKSLRVIKLHNVEEKSEGIIDICSFTKINVLYIEGKVAKDCSAAAAANVVSTNTSNANTSTTIVSGNQCEQLKQSIKTIEGINDFIKGCDPNGEGKITKLVIGANTYSSKKLKRESIEKIFSYTSVTSFTYEHELSTIQENELPISRFTNLNELVISNSQYSQKTSAHSKFFIANNVIRNIPKSVKKLSLQGVKLTQTNVDELTTLTQVEDLSLNELGLDQYNLRFDGFSKFKKVTKLSITEENKVNTKVFNIINKFSNLQELSLDGSYRSLSIKKKDVKLLQKMKYLRTIRLLNVEEKNEAVTDICSFTNISELYIGGRFKSCSTYSNSSSSYKSNKSNKTQTIKISTSGKCGRIYGRCPHGECCSKYGYCGASDKYCGSGCQSEFGICNIFGNYNSSNKSSNKTNNKISKNGKCGRIYGRCPHGECCSQYGYCGTSRKYCGSGCQSEFGMCNPFAAKKPSNDGKCGKMYGKCPHGECCSQYGYCGTSKDYCGTGCQRKYGLCFKY